MSKQSVTAYLELINPMVESTILIYACMDAFGMVLGGLCGNRDLKIDHN